VIVLGSILAGIATPTEAAVLGVLCVLLTGGVLYRELTLAALARQVLATLRTTAAIFFIIATAAVFGRVLTLYGAAQALADWITGLTSEPTVFLIGVNLVYLVLGCVVDTVPILLVFVPLLMPTVQKLGIDPIHFGVITVFNLLIGLITPPYGLTMYLLCRMSNISLVQFWGYAWPIFLMMIAALGLTTFVPALTVTLPNLVLP
jgi:tripartite ATP-independent transporter DctM subunit